MTFIDRSQARPSPGFVAGYSVLCALSLLCAYWAVNIGRSRQHYRSFFSVRVLFPLALFVMALENAALAASGRVYDGMVEGRGKEDDVNFEDNLFMKAVFVLQTLEVPILLVVIFEITYLVHKRRSVNFCGMYFDEGVRIQKTAFTSCILRNSIRSLATLLLVMGLVVNFDLFESGTSVDELAGRAGWWNLAEDWNGKYHLLLSLIPTAVLTLVAFYLSIMLWRYGTESAMVVHSSICNPWFYSFFGTLAMGVGQIFAAPLYTIMSNAGMLIFVIMMLLLMTEVDKDMVAANDVAGFLVSVAQKGDQIRIVESVPPSSSIQQRREGEQTFGEEEKRPKDEETAALTANENDEPNSNPKKPSYYADSFHEHFFPHTSDGGDRADSSLRKPLSLPQTYAASMARRPWLHLAVAFVVAVVLSFIGLQYGNFEVSVDNAGWWSRGTLIANRATQEMLVKRNRRKLFFDATGEVWDELQDEVQPNWQGRGNDGASDGAAENADDATLEAVCSGEWYGSPDMAKGREDNLVSVWKTEDAQKSALDADAMHDLCTAEENTLRALQDGDSCYKCGAAGRCIEPYSLVLMARLHLTDDDVFQWGGNSSRLAERVSCDELRSSWTPSVQRQFTIALKICVNWFVRMASSDGMDKTITLQGTTINITNPCPLPVRFLPTMVDESFPIDSVVRYSSSYYATKRSRVDVRAMYEANENDAYDRSGGAPVSGVYDTADESFGRFYADAVVGRDMSLAVGSAGVTVVAMVAHTRSPFLTLMGLFQILLSFPLAYFVYHFVAGLVFFPFLNFIGIFVVFALGADDVFVAVDKWKNARHELPHGTTEQVAALALPDAAYAMLLTSLTTAVAFFGTAICPVGPIVCFALFCGLLITLDYVMNILLVFPALCLYDKWLLAGSTNYFVSFDWCCCGNDKAELASERDVMASDAPNSVAENEVDSHESIVSDGVEEHAPAEDAERTVAGGRSEKQLQTDAATKGKDPDDEERQVLLDLEHQTLIHRILDGYYDILHEFRWPVLAIVFAAILACSVVAAQLSLPVSSDVAILPDSNEYQKHWAWSQNLLSKKLAREEGGAALILWGVKPADTGDHLNPDSWTTLVLDDSFDPKLEDSQLYLLNFCDRLFEKFGKVDEDYQCPMVLFDMWLKDQSSSERPSEAYAQNCNGANSTPVPTEDFDSCIISWSRLYNNTSILQKDGSVKIMEVRSKSNVVYDMPQSELKEEWTTYETWLDNERSGAPSGVNRMYHSDIAFWWFDTNEQMMKTAYGAAGIALVCAAAVVFVSARSFVLTSFAAISIVYVLVAATACLVLLGWELGFLESILFAILIGISCDFVIHVGHAYTMYSGNVNRHQRSHFSLTHMGPSILAAAFTTFMAAVVMIFTEITFFRKFAVILFMTILHSTIGCFVVFLVLCDCFGPAEPTKGYDTIKAKVWGREQKD